MFSTRKPSEFSGKLSPVTSRQSFALSAVVTDVHDVERLRAFTKIDVNDTGKFGTILTVDRFEGRFSASARA
jgi:hypothetical protein